MYKWGIVNNYVHVNVTIGVVLYKKTGMVYSGQVVYTLILLSTPFLEWVSFLWCMSVGVVKGRHWEM